MQGNSNLGNFGRSNNVPDTLGKFHTTMAPPQLGHQMTGTVVLSPSLLVVIQVFVVRPLDVTSSVETPVGIVVMVEVAESKIGFAVSLDCVLVILGMEEVLFALAEGITDAVPLEVKGSGSSETEVAEIEPGPDLLVDLRVVAFCAGVVVALFDSRLETSCDELIVVKLLSPVLEILRVCSCVFVVAFWVFALGLSSSDVRTENESKVDVETLERPAVVRKLVGLMLESDLGRVLLTIVLFVPREVSSEVAWSGKGLLRFGGNAVETSGARSDTKVLDAIDEEPLTVDRLAETSLPPLKVVVVDLGKLKG